MSEYLGSDYLYSALSSASDVTDLVSTNIFNARLIPEGTESFDTINFYQVTNYDASLNYFELTYSVDCRSKFYPKSQEIALAVVDALNRESAIVNGYAYYGVCDILAVIPPIDSTDAYNTPVEVRLRRR